jgi:hypothetical protein
VTPWELASGETVIELGHPGQGMFSLGGGRVHQPACQLLYSPDDNSWLTATPHQWCP